MSQDEKEPLTEESFADDPLAQRIYKRTQPELRRQEREDFFLNPPYSDYKGGGAILAGLFIVFTTLWAIIVSIYEAIPYELERAKENRRRKREEASKNGSD